MLVSSLVGWPITMSFSQSITITDGGQLDSFNSFHTRDHRYPNQTPTLCWQLQSSPPIAPNRRLACWPFFYPTAFPRWRSFCPCLHGWNHLHCCFHHYCCHCHFHCHRCLQTEFQKSWVHEFEGDSLKLLILLALLSDVACLLAWSIELRFGKSHWRYQSRDFHKGTKENALFEANNW